MQDSKFDPLMTELGQKHALPHCNSNGRFTSISGHKVDVLIAHRLPTPSGETALGPAMTQCRPADTSSVLPEPFEPIRRQSRIAGKKLAPKMKLGASALEGRLLSSRGHLLLHEVHERSLSLGKV